MKRTHLVAAIVAACSVGWVGRSVFSEDAAPGGGMDFDKLVEKLATPGEQHERLKALVGEWNVKGKFTDPKTGKVEESGSTSSMRSVFGGRYLIQDVKGSMMGQPFEGHGIMGFDNATKKYFSVWIDSMGTGVLSSEGEETEKGKTWVFRGPWDMGGGMVMTSTLTIKVVNDKEQDWEMSMGMKGKPEASVMTLHSTRK